MKLSSERLSVLVGMIILLMGSMLTISAKDPTPDILSDSSNTDHLFVKTKIWEIHLEFTAENWDLMDPRNQSKRDSSATGMGWGGFLAPAFIGDGDLDLDDKLSKEEFQALGSLWFNKWSDEKTGMLNEEQLGSGFTAAINQVSGGKFTLKGAKGDRNGIASVIGLEYPESTGNMEINNTPFESASVRYKGNGTFLNARDSQKLPFKIDLNDGYPDRKLAGVVKLNLHNCITDPSYMNEVVAHQLFRDAGVPAPRTSYARVYVTVEDKYDREYFGLYSIVENVDKNFIEDRFGTRKGAIFKPVTPMLFKDLGDRWEAYEQIYDPKTRLKDHEKWRLIDLCRLVSHASDYEFASRIGDYIDLDETARYMAVTVLIADLDGILGSGQNFYLYLHPRSNKFNFITWDQDHSFGQWTRTQEMRENLSLIKPWDKENIFLERLFNVPEFNSAYLAHIDAINDTLFTPERISRQVDELASVLRPAIRDDSPENLELFNRLVSMESHHSYANILPERGPDDPRPSPGSFGSDLEAKPIKGFVAARTISVDDQLAGRSEGLSDEDAENNGTRNWNWVAGIFLVSMDRNGDGELSRDEFYEGFDNWYKSWQFDSEKLSEKDLKRGLNGEISSMRKANNQS